MLDPPRAVRAADEEVCGREIDEVDWICTTNGDNESALPQIVFYPPHITSSTFPYFLDALEERFCLPLSSWSVSKRSEPSWSYRASLASCIYSWGGFWSTMSETEVPGGVVGVWEKRVWESQSLMNKAARYTSP